jgi:hypothetical protein
LALPPRESSRSAFEEWAKLKEVGGGFYLGLVGPRVGEVLADGQMGEQQYLLRSPTHMSLPWWNQGAALRVLPGDAVHFHKALRPALHACQDPEKGALARTGRSLDGYGLATGLENDAKRALGQRNTDVHP